MLDFDFELELELDLESELETSVQRPLSILFRWSDSQYMCTARHPWLWKKCAIARVEVVNVGREGLYGLCRGGGRGCVRIYGMSVIVGCYVILVGWGRL